MAVKQALEQDITDKVNDVLDKIYPVGSTYAVTTVFLKDKLGYSIPLIEKINVLILVDTKKHQIKLTQSKKIPHFSL